MARGVGMSPNGASRFETLDRKAPSPRPSPIRWEREKSGRFMGRQNLKLLTRVVTMNRRGPSPQPSPRTLTPALSHPMGEGEFSDVLLARSPQFMGSKRELSLGEVSPPMGEREKSKRSMEREGGGGGDVAFDLVRLGLTGCDGLAGRGVTNDQWAMTNDKRPRDRRTLTGTGSHLTGVWFASDRQS